MNKKIVFIGTGAVAAELTSYLEDGSWGNDCTFEIKDMIFTLRMQGAILMLESFLK